MSNAPSPRGLGSCERKGLWRHVNKMGVHFRMYIFAIGGHYDAL